MFFYSADHDRGRADDNYSYEGNASGAPMAVDYRSFYRQSLACVTTWWALAYIVTKRPFHRVTYSSVVTKPDWLPSSAVLCLQRHRPWLFLLQPASLLVAGYCPAAIHESPAIGILVRLLAAIMFSFYHLTESSMTNRHGEYPLLHMMWALALCPDERWASCAALGIVVNFVLSTGYAKVSVGGDIFDWVHPETMRTYLNCYRNSKSAFNRPLFPSLSRSVSESDVCMVTMGAATIFLECVLVPSALFVPPGVLRFEACRAMIAMHVGIALVMSLKVGLVFTTSLAAYLYGFSCPEPASWSSGPWVLAVGLGLLPTLMSLIWGCSLIPENWPLTPVSLFMWPHKPAKALLKLCMVGNTRLVFATHRTVHIQQQEGKESTTTGIVGMRVVHHVEGFAFAAGMMDRSKDGGGAVMVVHDAVMRSISFTLVQGGAPLIRSMMAIATAAESNNMGNGHGVKYIGGEATRNLVRQTQSWLRSGERLIEAHTGEVLTHAYLVRVNERMEVDEVLLNGRSEVVNDFIGALQQKLWY